MASPARTGIAIGVALLATLTASVLVLSGLLAMDSTVDRLGLNGQATKALLPLQALLLLTLLCFMGALAIPHNRLALIQSIGIALWGLGMIVLGVLLVLGGLASFAALLALLFAFPFGTIAYFAMYSCTEGNLAPSVTWATALLGGGCMIGTQLSAIAAGLLKVLALAVLLLAAPRFLKVTGLLVVVLLSAAMSGIVAGGYWALSDLHFLLYPLDSLITALLGLIVVIHGAVTFVKSLFALALAIAGQVG
jgi:hypothetical protein